MAEAGCGCGSVVRNNGLWWVQQWRQWAGMGGDGQRMNYGLVIMSSKIGFPMLVLASPPSSPS
jgi:hypothetical protein